MPNSNLTHIGNEWLSDERCHISEIINRPEQPAASLARARVEPGVQTALHTVEVEEYYIIQSGQGEVRLGEQSVFSVGPGDVVRIPAKTPQQIRNTGSEQLIFECLCVPRFTPQCYQSLESE